MKQGFKDVRDGIAGAVGGVIAGLVIAVVIAAALKPFMPESRHYQIYGQVKR